MATTTTKLGLVKPDGGDLVDIAVLNANADKIDASAGPTICTSTTRPTSPYNGQLIFETNTYNQYIWVSATSTWARLGSTPAGSVVTLASATVPTGWLLCDGSSYLTSTYPDLAAAVNYTYGGSGSNFNVPDLRGRVAVGKAASGTFASLNSPGGAETHALTEAQMPRHTHIQDPHNHTVGIRTNASAFGDWAFGYTNNSGLVGSVATGNATAINQYTGGSGTAQSPSNGAAHNNLQPYLVLNYIIKT